MTPRRFPDDFLLGCATAAHQVEGGVDNDWSRWEREHPDRIADGSTSADACDHYARFDGDLTQLAALGQNAHRFSVEWSRVEPQPGRFDAAALAHYAEVVQTCRRLGMEPVVTLQHFTFPSWLVEADGPRWVDAPRAFARFAAACAAAFGDSVSWWVTINEPNVLAFMSQLEGAWPPGKRSLRGMFTALRGLLLMHRAAYAVLHRVAESNSRVVRVGIAHAERRLYPKDPASVADRVVALVPDWVFNRWFLSCCRLGRILPPVGRGERLAGLADCFDYIGLNYYCDDVVVFDRHATSSLFGRHESDTRYPQSTFGWSINPPGLRRAITDLWRDFRRPVLITENGVADDDDELRPQFIVDHLRAVLDAADDGADVRGYLHWTSWDNFEWAEGYTKRFGLFAVDRETQTRTPKPSAALFASICTAREVPSRPNA
ncbi:MAG TPA: family 1 glycosylhydrolase [Candidatus Dormibacteraeota bacterium]|nr:family 1 glycosylhydrolase [Candidatus Dormibacteraeota bacterium]